MKKIGLILFAFLAMGVSVVAQNDRPRGERGGAPRMNREQMVKNMTDNQVKRLKLNKEQAAKMQVLNDSLMSATMGGFGTRQRNAPRTEMSQADRDAQRKEREVRTAKAREKYNKDVKAILTPEQYKEFEKMEKERPQQGFGGRRTNGPGGQGGPGGFGGGRPNAPGGQGGPGGFGGGRNR